MKEGQSSAFLLLGSNMGNRIALLEKACAELKSEGVEVVKKSSVYESEPWGFDEVVPPFLNQVLQVQTTLTPHELLAVTQQIEQKLGRERLQHSGYTSRTIDIDILFYESDIVNTLALNTPHPKLHLRRFTLLPLVEIVPDFLHPVLKKTMKELLGECEDKSSVAIAREA